MEDTPIFELRSVSEKIRRVRREDLNELYRAALLVWKSSPGWAIASIVLVIPQGILPLASLYIMKLIVDCVASGYSSANKEAFIGQISMLIALAILLELLSILIQSAAGIVSEFQSTLVSDHIQDVIHAKSVAIDLEYYESPKYYDTLHRAQQEASYRPIQIVRSLTQLLQNSISMVTTAALLFVVSWAIVLALLIASVPRVLIQIIYSGKLYRWQISRTEKERKAWYMHWLLTDKSFAKEIRLFSIGSIFRDRYVALRQQLRKEKLDISVNRSKANLAARAIEVIAIFGSLAFLALEGLKGNITIGDVTMYFGALTQGQAVIGSILSSLTGLYEDKLFITNLYDFLDLRPNVREPQKPVKVPKPMSKGITFEGVSFNYPESSSNALKGLSLSIKPGQVVALVGENGSGKTTLIKLLCRLYDPRRGRIAIDGVDLRRMKVSDLRREISVVFQDYARYDLSLAENIWLGSADGVLDMDKVAKAAKDSGADKVLKRLDAGYETTLGKWFDNGTELSIGEWQKVALARAFIRDAQIIIMDEPTSSLDPKAEAEVFAKFRELAKGKTAIVIGHRLSTVRMADCIYLMKGGTIAEHGTHEELMTLMGEYAQLFEIQAVNYR
ncbi:MAG: ABC transporter ATP-binding protein [Methanothrix sp.]|nr:MAG: ABC transporter ATP-binding protein [Methanothrix sp.]